MDKVGIDNHGEISLGERCRELEWRTGVKLDCGKS